MKKNTNELNVSMKALMPYIDIYSAYLRLFKCTINQIKLDRNIVVLKIQNDKTHDHYSISAIWSNTECDFINWATCGFDGMAVNVYFSDRGKGCHVSQCGLKLYSILNSYLSDFKME